MNDRVLSALRVLGIGVPPIASLEQGGAFFALLEDTLIYQDAGGTRRVTLRDLTRIHSDQEGLLRVETPAGTALTASLLGYDPARVQSFFAQVRDATARAKNLPTAPLPGIGGQKTFSSAPPPTTPEKAPADPVREEPRLEKPALELQMTLPAPPEVRETPAEALIRPTPSARPPRLEGLTGDDLAGETVRVISKGSKGQPAPATPVVETTTVRPTVTPVVRSAPVVPTPAAVAVAPAPAPAELTPQSPPAVPVLPTRTRQMLARGGLAGLDARAEAVLGLVSRLRVLGALLGLAAVGLALFQFLGGTPLLGLWTLIAGGVGAIALLTFAEVTGLIAALARAVAVGVGDELPGAEPEGALGPDA